jgi:hypothetical protein
VKRHLTLAEYFWLAEQVTNFLEVVAAKPRVRAIPLTCASGLTMGPFR